MWWNRCAPTVSQACQDLEILITPLTLRLMINVHNEVGPFARLLVRRWPKERERNAGLIFTDGDPLAFIHNGRLTRRDATLGH